jgi:hypothetical protein
VPNASSPRSAASRAPAGCRASRRASWPRSRRRPRARSARPRARPARPPPARGTGRPAPVLPDDRLVHRPAARPLPQDRGLALVRDPDRGHVPRRHAAFASASRQTATVSAQMCSGRARPSRRPGRTAGARAAPSPPPAPRGRTGSPASSWCPGRWRGRARPLPLPPPRPPPRARFRPRTAAFRIAAILPRRPAPRQALSAPRRRATTCPCEPPRSPSASSSSTATARWSTARRRSSPAWATPSPPKA